MMDNKNESANLQTGISQTAAAQILNVSPRNVATANQENATKPLLYN